MQDNWLNIVLYEPQIPQNTGNIARLCAGTNAKLHIVEPAGFIMNSKMAKRAGLGYWNSIKKEIHQDWNHCLSYFHNKLNKDLTQDVRSDLPVRPVSTMGLNRLDKVQYNKNDILLFGSESKGLPAGILDNWAENSIYIPQWGETRSLNLSNSVALLIYEVARQFNYFL